MSSTLGFEVSGCCGGDLDSLLVDLFLVTKGSSSLLNLLLPVGEPGDKSATLVKLKPGSLPKYSTETLL